MPARIWTWWESLVVVLAMLGLALTAAPQVAAGGAVMAVASQDTLPTVQSPLVQARIASLRVARPDFDLPAEATVRRFAPIVARAARVHGVDEALVQAVIFAESSYDPDALSPAGASGLMQLMPATAEQYGVLDLFDPAQNVGGGVRLLRDLLKQFDGNVELAVAAYNAGAYAVIRAGNRVPAHPETTAYVPKVIAYYRHLQALKG